MLLYKLRRYKWYVLGRIKIKKRIHRLGKAGALIKVNIGAGPSAYEGWIGTDLPHFDILRAEHWEYFFSNYKPNYLLSEHVLEHLTEDQVNKVLELASKYIAPKGNFRIAVPERNHPNKEYIDSVKPGGTGLGADDHKSFWNLDMITEVAQKHSFEVDPIEHYDNSGDFHFSDFSDEKGHVKRSGGKSKKFWPKTSLIVDLIQPE